MRSSDFLCLYVYCTKTAFESVIVKIYCKIQYTYITAYEMNVSCCVHESDMCVCASKDEN